MTGVMAYQEEVIFNIHNIGIFEFGPLMYVQMSISKHYAFIRDKLVLAWIICSHALRKKNGHSYFVCLTNIRKMFEVDSHRQWCACIVGTGFNEWFTRSCSQEEYGSWVLFKKNIVLEVTDEEVVGWVKKMLACVVLVVEFLLWLEIKGKGLIATKLMMD